MELYAENGIFLMLYRHDLPFVRHRRDGKAVRHGFGDGGQGMIAGNADGFRPAAEQGAVGGGTDQGLLSVHEPFGVIDGGAEDLANALVSQADSQDGNLRPQGFDDIQADPSVLRVTRPRRKDDLVRAQGGDFPYGKGIVPDNPDVGIQGADGLVQVIGKLS